jgi:exosortase/archaeosortase family protein
MSHWYPALSRLSPTLRRLLHPLQDVLIFFALLLGFHFLYVWWAEGLEYRPIEPQVLWLFERVSDMLLRQSLWVLQALPGVEVVQQGQSIHLANGEGYVSVVPECTSLKQWMHWMVIMAFFPGPWKHKLWYIPAGILIIHGVNIFRITGLTLVQIPFPGHFHFFHDYFFKTLFYLVIFGMWVVWVERFRR